GLGMEDEELELELKLELKLELEEMNDQSSYFDHDLFFLHEISRRKTGRRAQWITL
ncbi:hypothetical protein HKX48_003242, partial [Thoreauomyces humboldtii]